jgi:hypothetical protein
MKTFLSVLGSVAALAIVCNSHAWDMTWLNTTPWFGPDGVTPIAPGGMVQLIADGGDGVLADPMTVLTDIAVLAEWFDAGFPPIGPAFHPELGDDFLVESTDAPNPTYFRDSGPGYDGYFDAVYIQSVLPAGTQMYTRFFATTGMPSPHDWCYGNIGSPDGTSDFYVLPDEAFPVYAIEVAAVANIGLVPEPGAMLIGGVAILIGVVKMKRRRGSGNQSVV